MFLLIQSGSVDAESGAVYFTFQYVSINTLTTASTYSTALRFTFQYVSINTVYKNALTSGTTALHSNMFLLIPKRKRG